MAFKSPPGFSPQVALDFLGFCQQAYNIYYIYKGVTQPNGQPYVFSVPQGYDMTYEIWGDGTILDIDEGEVPYGFVAQKQGRSDLVVTVRGTEGDIEWADDLLDANQVANPVPNSQGLVHDGFADIYNSLTYVPGNTYSMFPPPPNTRQTLGQVVANASSVAVTGHSLGSSLADLVVLDVVLNARKAVPFFYTLASPRTGDPTFANSFDAKLQAVSYRIANVWDIVPTLPPDFFVTFDPLGGWYYQHVKNDCKVDGGFTLDLVYSHSLLAYKTGLEKLAACGVASR
jgi:triacylglycerol lipase